MSALTHWDPGPRGDSVHSAVWVYQEERHPIRSITVKEFFRPEAVGAAQSALLVG